MLLLQRSVTGVQHGVVAYSTGSILTAEVKALLLGEAKESGPSIPCSAFPNQSSPHFAATVLPSAAILFFLAVDMLTMLLIEDMSTL